MQFPRCSNLLSYITSATSSKMSSPDIRDSIPKSVDLDDLFITYAKKSFEKRSKDVLEKSLKTNLSWEKLTVTVDYSKFSMETSDYDHQKLQPMTSSNHVVFMTTYTNTTSSSLKYTLNIERTTRNVTSMRLFKGLTHSGNIGLKLKLPGDICELEGGYSRELTMEKEQETSREEEMVWSANTEIQVPPNTDTTMELVVKEQEYDGTFHCTVRLCGQVTILIYKGETQIDRVIAKNFEPILPSNLGFYFDEKFKTINYRISGTCFCRKGMKQSIKLSEIPHSSS